MIETSIFHPYILPLASCHVLVTLIGLGLLWAPITTCKSLRWSRALLTLLFIAPAVLIIICPRDLGSSSITFTLPQPAAIAPETSSPMLGATIGAAPLPFTVNWMQTTLLVWIAGSALGLLWLSFSIILTLNHLKCLSELSPADRMARGVAPQWNSRNWRWCEDPGTKAPYSFRWWTPCLVLPPSSYTERDSDLERMIRHEASHLQNADAWYRILWSTLRVLYWWNPFVHLLARRHAELQEWRADDAAVGRNREDSLAFSRTLLDRASVASPNRLTQGMATSTARALNRRLTRLLKGSSAPSPHPSWSAVPPILTLLAAATFVGCAQWLPARHESRELLYADGQTRAYLESHPPLFGDSIEDLVTKEANLPARREITKRLSQVPHRSNSKSMIALEFAIVEHLKGRPEPDQPRIHILPPSQAEPYLKIASPLSAQTQNARPIMINSIINEPIILNQSQRGTEIGLLPIGTIIHAVPALLKSGQIHCEIDFTKSAIVGQRVIEGIKYPVVASHTFAAPITAQPGHTAMISGIRRNDASGKTLSLLVTPTVSKVETGP